MHVAVAGSVVQGRNGAFRGFRGYTNRIRAHAIVGVGWVIDNSNMGYGQAVQAIWYFRILVIWIFVAQAQVWGVAVSWCSERSREKPKKERNS